MPPSDSTATVTGGRPAERLPRDFFDRPATEVAPDLLGCVLWHDSPAGLVAVRLVEVEAYMGADDPASHAYRGQTARNTVMFGPPGHVYVYFTYGMHFCANLVCQPPGLPEAVLLRAGEVILGTDLATRRRMGERDPAADDPVHETGMAGTPRVRPRSAADTGSDGSSTDHAGAGHAGIGGSGSDAGSRGGGGPASAGKNGRVMRSVDLARGPARLCQALSIDGGLDGADVCALGSPLGIGPPSAADQQARAAGHEIIRTGPRVGISRAADRPWRYWLAGDGHVSIYRPLKPRPPRRKPVSGRGTEDGTMLQ
jgi:DNA-3-methyladenine glycosylase